MAFFVRIPAGKREITLNLDAVSYVRETDEGPDSIVVHFDRDQACPLQGEAAANLLSAIDRYQRTIYGHIEPPKKLP